MAAWVRDTGPTVDVVLWGERATAFPAEQVHRDSGSSLQIIIFVGTLVRSYAVPEHKKLKDIKYLHPFENNVRSHYSAKPCRPKKNEWLVIVKVLKIDSSWWYNACKKCLRTTKPHDDTYKCTNNSYDNIGSPTPRYKISLTAEDDTDTVEFIFFGRMAQRLIKKCGRPHLD
ncbi:putative replication protein [Zea mays]|uniref:Putative replication protein n=1 Tax=Zea mays TaxID=4577 RepID=A0A1D6HL20_MAIZE|nr:putative replication protein [Zea mays]